MLVIFIHVSSTPITALNKSGLEFAAVFLPWRFSSFVVQGFIFLSALRMFLGKNSGINYRKFYSNRLIRIVVPYIAWNLIYYLYFVLKGYFPFSLSRSAFISSGETLSARFISSLLSCSFTRWLPYGF